MSEIEIDVAKSWNELRWIDDQEAYRSNLGQFSKDQIKEAQDLALSVEAKEWSFANIHLFSLLHEIESHGIITKIDLVRTIAQIGFDFAPTPKSLEIIQRNLITCIYLVQNSLFQRGKKIKLDISKIAALAIQKQIKPRKEYVYIYKGIVYPYFKCYDIDATLYQIKKDRNNAPQIAITNFLGLLGLSLDLTEQLKLLYPKSPIVPQAFAAPEKISEIELTKFRPLFRKVYADMLSGMSLPKIAKVNGLSEQQVTNILNAIGVRSQALNEATGKSSLPALPQEMGTDSNDFNPPPVVVTDRDGDAFHSLLIGRKTKISFHRTLRIPEDGNDYPLPAGLGDFPIHRVEDYADTVPPNWLEEGGFFIPLYQREALFIQFQGQEWCPAIAKVCVGQINAITGKPYSEKLSSHSQDYVVIPKQEWLDGINSGDGTVRQFVAMPLGKGYTVEAQITDEERYGGFQLVVYEAVDGRFNDPDFSINQKVDFIKRISTAEFETMLNSLNRREKAIIESLPSHGKA